jgi:hypothetical protein
MLLQFLRKESKIMAYIVDYSYINQSNLSFGTSSFKSEITENDLVENNFLTAIYRKQNYSYPKFFKMDNLSKTGFLSAELLQPHFPDLENRKNVGVICFNRISSLTTDRNFENTIIDVNNYYPSPALFVYTLPNIETGEICIRHKFMGESSFYVTEHFNPKYIADIVEDSLKFNDIILSGWSDFVNSQIKSLMFLVSKNKSEGSELFDSQNIEKIFKTIF